MKKIKFIIIITIIIVILGRVPMARAQSLSLSISPPLLEVMIKPGKSITQLYKLVNDGDQVIITPKLYELGFNGIKDDPDFTPDKWISIVGNDMAFDKPFVLDAKKEADFLLQISPANSTSEQDYYRAIVFATTPIAPIDSTMTSFAQKLASPILITVTSTGILTKAAQITKFDLSQIVDSFDPLAVYIEIKNTGKTYFRPVGKISLVGPVGRGDFDIVPNAVLSGQNRQIISEHIPPLNKDNASLYLPGFYLGRYQVNLNFALDESTTKMSQTKIFYALPWKLGLGVVIIVLLILGKIKRRRKNVT